jgi:hypothetical protein
MDTEDKFDFDLNELATDQETAQDQELRKQVMQSAGNILATVKKLANKGDLNNLRRIERSLTEAPEQRRGARDDRPEPRTRQQTTPPAAPATEPAADDAIDETQPTGLVRRLFSRVNQ